MWGRFRYILDTKSEPAQNNEKIDLAAMYCTSGMSQIPKTILVLNIVVQFCLLLFQCTDFWARISLILMIFGVPWGLYWGTFGSLVGVIFRVFEKGAPRVIRELRRYDISASQGRGAQRRHLAQAKLKLSG